MGIGPGEVHSPTARRAERLNERNYRITPADQLGSWFSQAEGARESCRDRAGAAPRPRAAVCDRGREGRAGEVCGLGGIPQVFTEFGPQEWQAERERLRSLLAPEMYQKARASTLNAHYTSATVIDGISKAVERLGFRGGRVLEPALGVGHFFGLMLRKWQIAPR